MLDIGRRKEIKTMRIVPEEHHKTVVGKRKIERRGGLASSSELLRGARRDPNRRIDKRAVRIRFTKNQRRLQSIRLSTLFSGSSAVRVLRIRR